MQMVRMLRQVGLRLPLLPQLQHLLNLPLHLTLKDRFLQSIVRLAWKLTAENVVQDLVPLLHDRGP